MDLEASKNILYNGCYLRSSLNQFLSDISVLTIFLTGFCAILRQDGLKELSVMTSLHSYRNGGFPPANKLLDKIWHHEDYKRHKKKVKTLLCVSFHFFFFSFYGKVTLAGFNF